MILLPIFERLNIDNYGLYPGQGPNEPGLDIIFPKGLTLILGANGLGKTTLVSMLYRMLTGPYDIPALNKTIELGGAALEVSKLKPALLNMFRGRVADEAENAVARLRFKLGEETLTIERSLNNLKLISFKVNSENILITNEKEYQRDISKIVGVESFSDLVLILRYIIFYFEDRKALLWDTTAQRQILRVLFLSEYDTRTWKKEERRILSLDSEKRNLNATYTKAKTQLSNIQSSLVIEDGLSDELKTLQNLQTQDEDNKVKLKSKLSDLDSTRIETRQILLKYQDTHESSKREYERAKLIVLQEQFPKYNDTAHYILSQLVTENKCLVCGAEPNNIASELEHLIQNKKCLLCSSPVVKPDNQVNYDLSSARLEKNDENLLQNSKQLHTASQRHQNVLEEYESTTKELRYLNSIMRERELRIRAIIEVLPPEDTELNSKRGELEVFEDLLRDLDHKLKSKRKSFSTKMDNWNNCIVEKVDDIQKSFNLYANRFLFETCNLKWAPERTTLGQAGEKITFPAFALDMSGSNFFGTIRRKTPEQVSESQREFIDLSFRIALMEAISSYGGSLIIDAPESSLDAIFVERAATTLSSFATHKNNNRLIITSNLVGGELIPSLLGGSNCESNNVVNLFELATPTAAVKSHMAQYLNLFESLTSIYRED